MFAILALNLIEFFKGNLSASAYCEHYLLLLWLFKTNRLKGPIYRTGNTGKILENKQ